MSENVNITPGSGDTVAADDIGGVKYQRIKLVLGNNNTNDGDVSSSNPMPTDTGLTQPTTPSDTQPVSAASLPLPTGAATSANQQTDALTDDELRATPVPMSASSLPLPTGAATAANQQNDALTDSELRATPVPMSASSLPLPTGAATAANQQTDALTDTELRATPVPMSASSLPLPTGAATAANQQTDALTDTELRATPVPMSASSLPLPTGAATAANQQNDALTDDELRAAPVPVVGNRAIDNYSFSAISKTSTHKYLFFEDADLNWYIRRKTLATSISDYTKGTGGYASVYVDSTSDPSGSPTWASYGGTF